MFNGCWSAVELILTAAVMSEAGRYPAKGLEANENG